MTITQEQIAEMARKLTVEVPAEWAASIPPVARQMIEARNRKAADMLEQLAAERGKVAGVLATDLTRELRQEGYLVPVTVTARILAGLEPAPDAPVTVSSTEQDLGALVEHFKAKAEKAYADGVRDAAKVAESYGCCHVPEEIAAAILALLTEKPHE